jgi:hypothetical protein
MPIVNYIVSRLEQKVKKYSFTTSYFESGGFYLISTNLFPVSLLLEYWIVSCW